jgi:predicted nucleotidyltransferase
VTLPSRQHELLERLVREQVRFVLVGGHAVGAWGHIRATDDVDLVPDPDADNIDRLARVAEALGGRVVVGDRALGPSAIRTFLRAGDKTLIRTELGELDVLQGLPTIPRFDQLDADAHEAEVGGITVRVCSLEHLRAMKRASDRQLDQVDLDALDVAHPETDDA